MGDGGRDDVGQGMVVRLSVSLPRRERPLPRILLPGLTLISIHAPVKGATRAEVAMIFYRLLFQSTLPRRERRDNLSPNGEMINISIHAPAKGATRQVCTLRHQFDISIHAPAKGATFRRTCTCFQLYAFQSTLPRRERRGRPSDRGE